MSTIYMNLLTFSDIYFYTNQLVHFVVLFVKLFLIKLCPDLKWVAYQGIVSITSGSSFIKIQLMLSQISNMIMIRFGKNQKANTLVYTDKLFGIYPNLGNLLSFWKMTHLESQQIIINKYFQKLSYSNGI